MADTTFEEFELDQEDEANFDDPESLRKVYHELLSISSILSKGYKKIVNRFKKIIQKSFKTWENPSGSIR